ncbi:cysteine desulfurase NifS [Candidatus Woesearchaeota archaeon CG10_big_fil_rev_8_21_14_0_10_47_5]|nr:MAG: cysteine desulfurase NifS [Candidatus Woesearchaeota archaeon CG10_big_fil_rev_8_21_14_0_10_47_5]
MEKARATIANAIHAKPSEIIFTSGGTESDNLAILGFVSANKGRGNHIITTRFEHPAVLNTCKHLESEGFRVTYLPVTREGIVGLEELEMAITDRTVLVSIMHANNEIGSIQPLDRIADVCKSKSRGICLHSDAVQSFTKLPIDVSKTRVDMLSMSAHKIHGPKGVGALYLREGVKINRLVFGGHHERDLRPGTENIAGIVGFAKAVELMNRTEIASMTKLRDMLIRGIMEGVSDVVLNGSQSERLCNNVNISFKYVEGESLLLSLDAEGIAVSTGSACSSRSLEPSHVLLSIGLRPEMAHGSLRFTLSRFTTEEEIDHVLEVLPRVVKRLRDISPLKGG